MKKIRESFEAGGSTGACDIQASKRLLLLLDRTGDLPRSHHHRHPVAPLLLVCKQWPISSSKLSIWASSLSTGGGGDREWRKCAGGSDERCSLNMKARDNISLEPSLSACVCVCLYVNVRDRDAQAGWQVQKWGLWVGGWRCTALCAGLSMWTECENEFRQVWSLPTSNVTHHRF